MSILYHVSVHIMEALLRASWPLWLCMAAHIHIRKCSISLNIALNELELTRPILGILFHGLKLNWSWNSYLKPISFFHFHCVTFPPCFFLKCKFLASFPCLDLMFLSCMYEVYTHFFSPCKPWHCVKSLAIYCISSHQWMVVLSITYRLTQNSNHFHSNISQNWLHCNSYL